MSQHFTDLKSKQPVVKQEKTAELNFNNLTSLNPKEYLALKQRIDSQFSKVEELKKSYIG